MLAMMAGDFLTFFHSGVDYERSHEDIARAAAAAVSGELLMC